MGNSDSRNQFCRACGAPVGVESEFCAKCGQPVHGASEASLGGGRWWWVAAGVVLVAVLAVGGAMLLGGRGSGEPAGVDAILDPGSVELPVIQGNVDVVREFVKDQGSDLIDFHAISADLLDLDPAGDDAAATCRSLAEDVAGVGSTPGELLDQAAAVSDETTALLLVNDVAAKRDLLVACAAGDAELAAGYLEEVRFTHGLVTRRFAELGVAE